MPIWSESRNYLSSYFADFVHQVRNLERAGQTLVEFTLVFVLFVVVAWIPADFGLAFYTFHLAQNATREGARIAAAEKTLVAGTTSCTLGLTCGAATGPLKSTADRLSSALLRGATVSMVVDSGTSCDRNVTVAVDGQYRYFFYSVLQLMGISVLNPAPLRGSTSMRWEHQC